MTGARTLSSLIAAVLVLFLANPLASGTGPDGDSRLGEYTASEELQAEQELPRGLQADWWSEAQRRIRESEYHVTWQEETALADLDAAWQAPNRAHGFRTYFTEGGIRVVPRTEATPSWEWGLELTGYGRGTRSWSVGGSRPTVTDNTVRYDRNTIVEWYVNDARGVEQGFVLSALPSERKRSSNDEVEIVAPPRGPQLSRIPGEVSERAIFLEFRLHSSLSPSITPDGQAISFRRGRGPSPLNYTALKVTDAAGKDLVAWMEGFNRAGVGGIRLVFIDDGVVWPVTIDPLLQSPSWSHESNQTAAEYGFSVGTAGDVDGDGDSEVIVGAHKFDNGQGDEGRAFVYEGSPGGLSLNPDWTAESDQIGARFGVSVATAGDVDGDGYSDVIVGAVSYDNDQTNEGRVYVYHGSAAGLENTPSWQAESDQSNSNFGFVVGTAGDVNRDGYSDILIGAHSYDNDQPDEGRVFVYHGSADGLLGGPLAHPDDASWFREGDQNSAAFGRAAAFAGDVDADGYADVIVGAPGYNDTLLDEGAAFVYHGSPTGLGFPPRWTKFGGQALAQFGFAVATAGDVNVDRYADVIVGAQSYDNGESDEGAAFVFHGSASGVKPDVTWSAEGNQASAYLGRSVGTAGDVNGDGYGDVIVGAYRYDNGEADEGAAFVYFGSKFGIEDTPGWSAESNQGGAQFGVSVGTAGDIDGDGYSDVIVGAHAYDNGNDAEGGAFVYRGSAAGPSLIAGWSSTGPGAAEWNDLHVATAGDVNGDGYADLIVGAPSLDAGEQNEGRVYVYYGGYAGLQNDPDWAAESDQTGARFGVSANTAGDVNGDGYDDIIIGAEYYDRGESDEGAAFVYYGSPVGLTGAPSARPGDASWSVESDQVDAFLGLDSSSAGDVNGDGFADVIVGAHSYSNGEVDEGLVAVFYGSGTGLAGGPVATLAEASWTVESNQASALLAALGSAGDVNGDGFSDVLTSAIWFDGGEINEGAIFLFHGSDAGLSGGPQATLADADWRVEGDRIDEYLFEARSAGDVNGDGFADVAIGDYKYSNGESAEGRVLVFHGSTSGLTGGPLASLESANWSIESDQADSQLGWSVGSAGDVNGDGYSDLIAGAVNYTNTIAGEGRALLFLGSATGVSSTAVWFVDGKIENQALGEHVGTAGDVNGDGFADAIVATGSYSNPGYPPGKSFLYYGNDGPGLSIVPEQRRASDAGVPVAHLGASDSVDSIHLELGRLYRTPFGRGRVKLQWEIEPLGTLFDGVPTGESATWTDGDVGTLLRELVTGLTAETPYHWRLRVLYDPATLPFQPASRWLAVPWNGWQEMDFRTAALCQDTDADGFGDPGVASCPAGATTDCDDADASVYPGAAQLCDGINNDCDSASPLWPDVPTDELDDDGDGFVECEPWVGGGGGGGEGAGGGDGAGGDGPGIDAVIGGGDCDDTEAHTYPGAPEWNDGKDNQCPGDFGYGLVDENSTNSGFLDSERYTWETQQGTGLDEVLRFNRSDLTGDCLRLITPGPPFWIDPDLPESGTAFFYLNRPITPNSGSFGAGSAAERAPTCTTVTRLHWWQDTSGDDSVATRLQSFFNPVEPSTNLILFEVLTPFGDYALCAERADFYRDNYQTYAFGGALVTVNTGTWQKWRRRAGDWEGPTTEIHSNDYSGPNALDDSRWRAQAGDQLYLVIHPSLTGFDEVTVEDQGAVLCDSELCTVSIRTGPTRALTCGF